MHVNEGECHQKGRYLREILENVNENKKWFSYQRFLCYFNLNPKITYFLKSCIKWVLNLSSLHFRCLG